MFLPFVILKAANAHDHVVLCIYMQNFTLLFLSAPFLSFRALPQKRLKQRLVGSTQQVYVLNRNKNLYSFYLNHRFYTKFVLNYSKCTAKLIWFI